MHFLIDVKPGSDNRQIPNEDDLPINYRRGGARGGWGHGHDRDRIGTINRSFKKKRAVVYDDNAHFSLDKEFGDIALVNAQVETEVEAEAESDVEDGAFFEVYKKVKRGDDDAEVEEDEEEAEGDEQEEEEEEEEETEVGFQGFQEGDFSFNEFEEDNLAEEEDGDDEEGEEIDEEEEARLDSEAGLQDWIEEMKSEEYFNLAGHPTGEVEEEEGEEGEDEEGESMFNEDEPSPPEEEEEEGEYMFNEDEPSPSEEELFAASWGH